MGFVNIYIYIYIYILTEAESRLASHVPVGVNDIGSDYIYANIGIMHVSEYDGCERGDRAKTILVIRW